MDYNVSKSSIIADYYSAHYDELLSYVASRLQYAPDTEDVLQNVFLRLLQSDRMITPITLPCLVYTVAKNLIIDYWRRKSCREEYEHFVRTSDWLGKQVESAESVYSVHEVQAMLEKGIARLGETQSRVLRLNLYEGMQVSEIATCLDINYKKAEYNLGSARKEVRRYMKQILAS